jgi:hypothetical protein
MGRWSFYANEFYTPFTFHNVWCLCSNCLFINQIKLCLCFAKFYIFLSLITVKKKPLQIRRISPTASSLWLGPRHSTPTQYRDTVQLAVFGWSPSQRSTTQYRDTVQLAVFGWSPSQHSNTVPWHCTASSVWLVPVTAFHNTVPWHCTAGSLWLVPVTALQHSTVTLYS